ncbi:heterokaryon incompatibility protein-domain-containing protein [Xylariaceae sp. FL1651]|nr:heterokaryon incompatibility protein-domain-containing protein [Xylariaceae sp. FL1651]
MRTRSVLLPLHSRNATSGLASRWQCFLRTKYQNPYAPQYFMIRTLGSSCLTSRRDRNLPADRHLQASVFPALSLSGIQDRLRLHLITAVPGTIIVLLNILLPLALVAGMILYTLEQEYKIEALDRLGIWLVISDMTGEHRSLGTDQPRKQDSTAHPAIEKDEIRLLVLEPGRLAAPLECQLVRCKATDDVWYEALSYVWGTTPQRHMIKCNGEMVGITENLESVLRHLRHPFGRRVLWVDAICIDQNDDEERGHQVQLMSGIFSQAKRVVVWLGEDTLDVRGAFSVRPSRGYFLGPEGIALRQSKWELKQSNFDCTMDNAAVSLSDGNLLPLIRLLERPWFRRLWVLQEAALAKEVILHCGKKRASWDEFSSILNQLKRKGLVFDRFTPKAAMGVEAVLEIEEIRSGTQQNLLCVLLGTCSAECLVLKDKVYGVLSLAGDYIPPSMASLDEANLSVFEPDYTVSTTEVFVRFAKWGIEVYGAPDVLSCTSRTELEPMSELQSLPSWVPDWTRLDSDMPFARYRFCHISQQEPLFISDQEVFVNSLTLEVPALYVDSVAQVGCKSQFKKTPFGKLWEEGDDETSKVMLQIHKWTDETARTTYHALAWIKDCERLAFSAYTGHRSLNEAPNQLWGTLTAGMNGEGQAISEDFGHCFQMYRDFLEACISAHKLGDSDIVVPRSRIDVVGQVEAALHMWSSKRRFAITNRGLTALVPNQTQEGDIVIIVANAKVPHILRPKCDGSYTVLGEAYLGNIQGSGLLGIGYHKGNSETVQRYQIT